MAGSSASEQPLHDRGLRGRDPSRHSILDSGRHKRGLLAAADRAFYLLFSVRVLPFDSRAALTYADIAAGRRATGRPISLADCQIAAITRSRGASVATRDMRGFAHCRIEVIDPWSAT